MISDESMNPRASVTSYFTWSRRRGTATQPGGHPGVPNTMWDRWSSESLFWPSQQSGKCTCADTYQPVPVQFGGDAVYGAVSPHAQDRDICDRDGAGGSVVSPPVMIFRFRAKG